MTYVTWGVIGPIGPCIDPYIRDVYVYDNHATHLRGINGK